MFMDSATQKYTDTRIYIYVDSYARELFDIDIVCRDGKLQVEGLGPLLFRVKRNDEDSNGTEHGEKHKLGLYRAV